MSIVLAAVAGWVIVVAGLTQVFGLSALSRSITPRLLRRALYAGTAGALVLTPAQADRSSSKEPVTVVTSHSLAGLRLPDRPVTAARVEEVVTVKSGDTLWAIAGRSLRHESSGAEIARSCAEWYAANRDVIGADPNLILPAQRLTPPVKDHS